MLLTLMQNMGLKANTGTAQPTRAVWIEKSDQTTTWTAKSDQATTWTEKSDAPKMVNL